MKTPKISISFTTYSDSNLQTKAASILQNMTGNQYFPAPVPTLAEMQVAYDAYRTAMLNAANLGRVYVAEKNLTRKSLELLLAQLGMYVMYIANGDVVILASSGFSPTKMPEPNYIVNPGNVTLVNGITSGELVASVKAVKGAVSYLHQYTPDPLTAESVWDGIPGSRSSVTFKNLEAGKKYWFRVAAIGRGEQIAYSSPNTQYVQ